MGIDKELMSCVGDLIDPSYNMPSTIRNDVANEPTHFSEYHITNKLPDSLVKAFDKHLKGPTDEEREAYAIWRAKEDERIRKMAEREARLGPAFLSDEWRNMMIDRQVDRCRDYIQRYG